VGDFVLGEFAFGDFSCLVISLIGRFHMLSIFNASDNKNCVEKSKS